MAQKATSEGLDKAAVRLSEVADLVAETRKKQAAADAAKREKPQDGPPRD